MLDQERGHLEQLDAQRLLVRRDVSADELIDDCCDRLLGQDMARLAARKRLGQHRQQQLLQRVHLVLLHARSQTAKSDIRGVSESMRTR
eukprot:5225282-Pleurochrysis_carterae.AAC.1